MAGLVVQTLAAFALLFAGWGFDDLGGFFSHPARAGFVGVALATLVWVFAWRLDLTPFRPGARPVGWQRAGLLLLFLSAISLVYFLAYADRHGIFTFTSLDFLRYLGLALYTGGNAVALFAVRALGKQYSGYVTLQEGHQLIDTGIYAVIRHPIYLRVLMVSAGLPLLFRSWLFLPALVLGVLFAHYRISREERLLAETFGQRYVDYCARTKRLLPGLY
jgi:protein-S-isoprenylcysteine O-methyltransferase Ste14